MTNGDILRGIRYLLNVSDAKVVELIELGGGTSSQSDVVAYLRREEEEGFAPCPDETMARFLNGLVIYKRGEDPNHPAPPLEIPITNNVVMKKLRTAFSLKDVDMIALIEKSGVLKISKAELGSFFRAKGHRNYRECGDQYLRNLLKALSL